MKCFFTSLESASALKSISMSEDNLIGEYLMKHSIFENARLESIICRNTHGFLVDLHLTRASIPQEMKKRLVCVETKASISWGLK